MRSRPALQSGHGLCILPWLRVYSLRVVKDALSFISSVQ
jgi:hypothetical protein